MKKSKMSFLYTIAFSEFYILLKILKMYFIFFSNLCYCMDYFVSIKIRWGKKICMGHDADTDTDLWYGRFSPRLNNRKYCLMSMWHTLMYFCTSHKCFPEFQSSILFLSFGCNSENVQDYIHIFCILTARVNVWNISILYLIKHFQILQPTTPTL